MNCGTCKFKPKKWDTWLYGHEIDGVKYDLEYGACTFKPQKVYKMPPWGKFCSADFISNLVVKCIGKDKNVKYGYSVGNINYIEFLECNVEQEDTYQ